MAKDKYAKENFKKALLSAGLIMVITVVTLSIILFFQHRALKTVKPIPKPVVAKPRSITSQATPQSEQSSSSGRASRAEMTVQRLLERR